MQPIVQVASMPFMSGDVDGKEECRKGPNYSNNMEYVGYMCTYVYIRRKGDERRFGFWVASIWLLWL